MKHNRKKTKFNNINLFESAFENTYRYIKSAVVPAVKKIYKIQGKRLQEFEGY